MNFLQKLYNSRNVLMEMLQDRNYDTSAYNNFSMKEIDIMFKNSAKSSSQMNPLDMKISKDGHHIYIKYVLNSKVRLSNIQQLVIDMKENVLNDNDELLIITRDKVSNESSLDSSFEALLKSNNIYVQLFWIDTIIINITKHEFVPKHRVLSSNEKEKLLEKYNISSYNQLPIIMKTDPVAKFYGMRRGDVAEITRPSETAGQYICYRYCQ